MVEEIEDTFKRLSRQKIEEVSRIENFVERYERETGERLEFVEFPDRNNRSEKSPDISFISLPSKTNVHVEHTKVVFSTKHIKNKVQWGRFFDDLKAFLKGQLTGNYVVAVPMPKGSLKQKNRDELLKKFAGEILAEAKSMIPKEVRNCVSVMPFRIRKILDARISDISFIYNLNNVKFGAEEIKNLLVPYIVEANEKFAATKSDLNVLLLDDYTELEILDLSTPIGMAMVRDAIKLIPENKRENITAYYVLERPYIFKVS